MEVVVIGDLYNVATEVKGTPNSTQQFTFSIKNVGNQAGVITVELYDHNGNLVGSKDFYLAPGESTYSYIDATLPSQTGTYTWTLVAVAGEPTDAVDITVIVEARSIAKFVSVSPTQIARKPGEQATISFTVQNTGYAGNIDVLLKLGDTVVVKKTYYLGSGDSTSDSITFTVPSTPGSYTYTLEAYGYINNTRVDTPDDTATITVEVGYPHFSITQYPDTVSLLPGDTQTITVRVLNDGVVSGSVTVKIKDHNGTVVTQQTTTLSAGVYEDLSFTITAPSTPSSYTWSIEAYNNDTDSIDDVKTFTVNVVATGNPIADIVQVSPTTISAKPSQTISMYVQVKNIGDVVGDIVVQLIDHNGNTVDSEVFTSVDPGETKDTSLYSVAPENVGTYTWKVVAYASSETEPDDIVTITIQVSVNYDVTIVDVDPSYIEGQSGDRVTITWWVRNDSDVPATITTKLLDNENNLIVEYTADLNPGEQTSFSYTIELPQVTECTQMSYYVLARADTEAYDEKSIGLYVCPPPEEEEPPPEEEVSPSEQFASQLGSFIENLLATIMQILMMVIYIQLMISLMSAIISGFSSMFEVR